MKGKFLAEGLEGRGGGSGISGVLICQQKPRRYWEEETAPTAAGASPGPPRKQKKNREARPQKPKNAPIQKKSRFPKKPQVPKKSQEWRSPGPQRSLSGVSLGPYTVARQVSSCFEGTRVGINPSLFTNCPIPVPGPGPVCRPRPCPCGGSSKVPSHRQIQKGENRSESGEELQAGSVWVSWMEARSGGSPVTPILAHSSPTNDCSCPVPSPKPKAGLMLLKLRKRK